MKEGRKAPAFKLPDQDGNTVSLSDFAAGRSCSTSIRRPTRPGCTTQACGIRDRTSRLRRRRRDRGRRLARRPDKLREFADKHDLPFTLLVDPDHKVAEKYGVWVEKSMYGRTLHGRAARDVRDRARRRRRAGRSRRSSPKKHDDAGARGARRARRGLVASTSRAPSRRPCCPCSGRRRRGSRRPRARLEAAHRLARHADRVPRASSSTTSSSSFMRALPVTHDVDLLLLRVPVPEGDAEARRDPEVADARSSRAPAARARSATSGSGE